MTVTEAAAARVVVIATLRLVREGLARVLADQEAVEVVASATDARDLAGRDAATPDVVVVAAEGEQAAVQLRTVLERFPEARIVALDAAEVVVRGLRSERVTALSGEYGVTDIVRAIGGRRPGRSPETAPTASQEPAGAVLTARETAVLDAIRAGGTTKDIAERLGISVNTVESHKKRIFGKLGVQGQAHAVAVSLRRGILPPSGDRSSG